MPTNNNLLFVTLGMERIECLYDNSNFQLLNAFLLRASTLGIESASMIFCGVTSISIVRVARTLPIISMLSQPSFPRSYPESSLMDLRSQEKSSLILWWGRGQRL